MGLVRDDYSFSEFDFFVNCLMIREIIQIRSIKPNAMMKITIPAALPAAVPVPKPEKHKRENQLSKMLIVENI